MLLYMWIINPNGLITKLVQNMILGRGMSTTTTPIIRSNAFYVKHGQKLAGS